MSETLEIIKEILNFLYNCVKGEHSHSRRSRLLAAFWGSWVFHFALLVDFLGRRLASGSSLDTDGRFNDFNVLGAYIIAVPYFFVVASIMIYSLTFSLIVVVSIPKGSLIRHFMYGILLPAFAYSMARIAFWGEIAKPVKGCIINCGLPD